MSQMSTLIIFPNYSIGTAFSLPGRTNIGAGGPDEPRTSVVQQDKRFFLGANAIYWQVRSERDGGGRADRYLAIYKEQAGELDPVLLDRDPSNDHLATTQWRHPPVSQPDLRTC
jgi:hypothetical protein